MPHNGKNGDRHSRRKILKGIGATGAAATVAGCSGDGGGDGTDTTDSGTDSTETGTSTPRPKEDTTFRYSWARDASLGDANINMLGSNSSGELGWPMYARFGKPVVATGDWVHCDVKGWEFDDENNELHITIKDGVKWHKQGGEVLDPVTGEDFAMQNEMDRLMTKANPDASVPEDPVVQGWNHDGKTYIAKLNPDGYNKDIITSGLPRTRIWMYRKRWQDRYESLKDGNQSEMEKVRQEIRKTNITLSDNPPLSGPYSVDSVSAQRVSFTRLEEHWSWDNNNWKNWDMVKVSASSNADYQAAVSDKTDYNFKIPSTAASPPDDLMQLFIESGAGFGECLLINYGGPVDWLGFDDAKPAESKTVGKRQAKARQGIAWALNGSQIAGNRFSKYAAEFTKPLSQPVPGNPAKIQDNFPDIWDAVPAMLQEPDMEKAEQAFRDSGLSMEGGQWVKPDGEPLTLKVESFPWSRDEVSTIVQNLKDANLKAEHITQESSVLFGNLGNGEYGLAQSWHPVSGPLSATVDKFLTREGSWESRYPPAKFEIPPVGEWNADPSQTINVKDMSQKLSTTSWEDHKGDVEKLVWAWMYHLPAINFAPNPSSTGFNMRNFEFPRHPPRSSGKDGRTSAPGDGSEAAPVYGVGQPFRMIRRGLGGENGPQAK